MKLLSRAAFYFDLKEGDEPDNRPPPFDQEIGMMLYYRLLYEGLTCRDLPSDQSLQKSVPSQRLDSVRSWRKVEKVFSADHQYIVANFSCPVRYNPVTSTMVRNSIGRENI